MSGLFSPCTCAVQGGCCVLNETNGQEKLENGADFGGMSARHL